MITRRCFNALAAASALASGIAAKRANALAWPTHPVRIVVPFAAGGPTDVIARIVGERLSKSWDQQVLIENRRHHLEKRPATRYIGCCPTLPWVFR